MTIWILTFFMFSYPAAGGSQTTVFSGAYHSKEACLLDAVARVAKVQQEYPGNTVQLGSSPCNAKVVL